jgi:N-formylglutamate deformylase
MTHGRMPSPSSTLTAADGSTQVAVYRVARPSGVPARPVVFDSPHSGFEWPADFHPAAPREAVRATWDAHVDELCAGVTSAGAAIISASFPRAYIDVNRAESDIDPAQLSEPWTGQLAPSDFCRRGMGLIRREALPNVPMYDRPLTREEVERRIETCYRPYRRALGRLLDEVHAVSGVVCHVDVHSVKSRGDRMNLDVGQLRPDIIVSDRLGSTAGTAFTAHVIEWFDAQGFRVQMNDPYRGGDLISTFGRPLAGRHSVQLAINRALYLNERTFERTDGFASMRHTMTMFAHEIGRWIGGNLRLTR